jgi:hypothetical protein
VNGTGGSIDDGSGRPVDRVVTARADVADQIVAEALRLSRGLQPALSALSSIGDSARRLSRYSARMRVLELEVLPAAFDLADRVRMLHPYPAARWTSQSPAHMMENVDEVGLLLERFIEVTATADIPGELGFSLELISTVQSGSFAGLACLARLRELINSTPPAHPDASLQDKSEHGAQPWQARQHIELGAARPLQPSAFAQRLLHAAVLLLPLGSRDRYAEEFVGELHELAEGHAGTRTQLAYALRQVAAVWALRRALPVPTTTAASPPGDVDRVRARDSYDPGATPGPRLHDHLLEPIDRWVAHRRARVEIRAQTRARHQALKARRPPPRGRRGRHRA